MHSEIASICVSVAADGITDPAPLPGSSLPHASWAAWNDGDAALIPELLLRLKLTLPPEAVGSGKFGTPRERIHDANLIPAAPRFDALLSRLLGSLEAPQPAIISALDRTATAIGTRRRGRWGGAGIPVCPTEPPNRSSAAMRSRWPTMAVPAIGRAFLGGCQLAATSAARWRRQPRII
jgi:hypothetical protein